MTNEHDQDAAESGECCCAECLPLFSHAMALGRELTRVEEREILRRPFGQRAYKGPFA